MGHPVHLSVQRIQKLGHPPFGGIKGLPTTMLYDRNGVLRMKVIGFEYTETVEAALKPLL